MEVKFLNKKTKVDVSARDGEFSIENATTCFKLDNKEVTDFSGTIRKGVENAGSFYYNERNQKVQLNISDVSGEDYLAAHALITGCVAALKDEIEQSK